MAVAKVSAYPAKSERGDHSDFYVYILFRHDTGQPFYVGKGRRHRWSQHERDARAGRSLHTHKGRIIAAALRAGASLPKVKLQSGLTNPEAAAVEVALIAAIGRRPNGPLVNQTEGGEGASGLSAEHTDRQRRRTSLLWTDPVYRARVSAGIAGFVRTPEWLAQKGAAITAANLGKPKSPEARVRMSEACKGRKHSDEAKRKIAAGNQGQIFTAERRAKISAALAGRSRGPHSLEHKASISAGLKGRMLSEAHKQALSASKRAKHLAKKAPVCLASTSE